MPELTGREAIKIRERKFVKKYIETGVGTTSVRYAYGSGKGKLNDSSASNMATELLKRPRVQRAMQEALERAGLGSDTVATSLKKIVKAGTSDDALDKATPDQAIRALDIVARITGMYADKHSTVSSHSVNVAVSTKTDNELDDMYSALLEDNAQLGELSEDDDAMS